MKCTAPECPFDATKKVDGTDYDGTPFVERVCQEHADYLSEHDGEEFPVNAEELP